MLRQFQLITQFQLEEVTFKLKHHQRKIIVQIFVIQTTVTMTMTMEMEMKMEMKMKMDLNVCL